MALRESNDTQMDFGDAQETDILFLGRGALDCSCSHRLAFATNIAIVCFPDGLGMSTYVCPFLLCFRL